MSDTDPAYTRIRPPPCPALMTSATLGTDRAEQGEVGRQKERKMDLLLVLIVLLLLFGGGGGIYWGMGAGWGIGPIGLIVLVLVVVWLLHGFRGRRGPRI
jgi:hypothetical protein